MRKQVEYRNAMVSYIDILGFKNLVAQRTATEIYEIYQEFYTQLKEENLTGQEEVSGIHYDLDVHFFSDSVVRIKYLCPESDTAFNAETEELVSLGKMQNNLLKKGVMIRGGVSEGMIFSDTSSNILFGPALIDAYLLESTEAVYPRLVISDAVAGGYHADMFNHPMWIRKDYLSNRWPSYIDTITERLVKKQLWWINYFWGPFMSLFPLLSNALEEGCNVRYNTDKMEELISSELSVLIDLNKIIEENRFPTESVRAKYIWCQSHMFETIKDIFEWVEGFNQSENVKQTTLNLLEEQAKLYKSDYTYNLF